MPHGERNETIQYLPTTGVRIDLKRFMNIFLAANTVRYEQFSEMWREKNMSFLFAGRWSDREAREFVERVIMITKEYFLPPYQFQVRVGGLYLLYALYQTQPLVPKVMIRMTPTQWKDTLYFQQQAAQQNHLDVVYVFQRLLHEQAFAFCYTSAEMDPQANLREKEDNEENLADSLKEEKSAINHLFNYESLEQLSYLQDQYQQMKIGLAGETATKPDKSLNVVQGELVEDLVVLMQTFREKVSSISKTGQRLPEPSQDKEEGEQLETTGSKRQALKQQAYSQIAAPARKTHKITLMESTSPTAQKMTASAATETKDPSNRNEKRQSAVVSKTTSGQNVLPDMPVIINTNSSDGDDEDYVPFGKGSSEEKLNSRNATRRGKVFPKSSPRREQGTSVWSAEKPGVMEDVIQKKVQFSSTDARIGGRRNEREVDVAEPAGLVDGNTVVSASSLGKNVAPGNVEGRETSLAKDAEKSVIVKEMIAACRRASHVTATGSNVHAQTSKKMSKYEVVMVPVGSRTSSAAQNFCETTVQVPSSVVPVGPQTFTVAKNLGDTAKQVTSAVKLGTRGLESYMFPGLSVGNLEKSTRVKNKALPQGVKFDTPAQIVVRKEDSQTSASKSVDIGTKDPSNTKTTNNQLSKSSARKSDEIIVERGPQPVKSQAMTQPVNNSLTSSVAFKNSPSDMSGTKHVSGATETEPSDRPVKIIKIVRKEGESPEQALQRFKEKCKTVTEEKREPDHRLINKSGDKNIQGSRSNDGYDPGSKGRASGSGSAASRRPNTRKHVPSHMELTQTEIRQTSQVLSSDEDEESFSISRKPIVDYSRKRRFPVKQKPVVEKARTISAQAKKVQETPANEAENSSTLQKIIKTAKSKKEKGMGDFNYRFI